MTRKFWVEDLISWDGFSYLRLKGVPMKRSKSGGVIDFEQRRLEKLVAAAILKNQVPIRGKELQLLRRVTGLSLEKFGRRLGISYGTIYHWEKTPRKRLTPINEIAVRLLCAEEMGFDLTGRFSTLIGDERHEPIDITVTNKKPTPKETKSNVKMMSRPSYRGHRIVAVKDES